MSKEYTVLWTQVQPVVAAYLGGATSGSVDADDLLQETAVITYQQFSKYDGNRPFAPWCLGIAHNVLRNYRRRKTRKEQVLDDDVLELLSETAQTQKDVLPRYSIRLRHCLERLSERSQRLIKRFYRDEVEQADLAAEEDMSHAAVRTAIHRSREKLRQCIEVAAHD